jgi:hypothetical protein
VETWDPGYGASTDEQAGQRTSRVEVTLDVELAPAAWHPIVPPATGRPDWSSVLFVDGVRRIDALGWVDTDGVAPAMGLFASFAAGVVCCRPDGARVLAAEVHRALVTSVPAPDLVTRAGAYRGLTVTLRESPTPAQQLNQTVIAQMRGVEAEVSGIARAEDGDDLLVVDGPLHGRTHLPRTLGYVKTHSTDYLPPELHRMAGTLPVGARTPVFALADSWPRFSWYLKLPASSGAPWAGVVRLECSADVLADRAVALADASTGLLGRFASTEYKDSRAPQNLYPIAGLERQLRRRLGDQALLYRAIRASAR